MSHHLTSSQLGSIGAEVAELESAYHSDLATFLGSVDRGVYTGAGVNQARKLSNVLALSSSDDTPRLEKLRARVNALTC
jgi:hypothetical protein